jgi:hypothetical protein
MDRREVLKYTVIITGSAVALPISSAILSGCVGDKIAGDNAYTPSAFTTTGFHTLSHVIDTILPATSSPSATDVGVHKVIDSMIGKVYNESDREAYLSGYALFTEYISALADGIFASAPPDRKLEILKGLDTSSDPDLGALRETYLEIKQQAIAVYLSTEKVSKEYLNFLPVPGEYQPCIPLSEVDGKAWAI